MSSKFRIIFGASNAPQTACSNTTTPTYIELLRSDSENKIW